MISILISFITGVLAGGLAEYLLDKILPLKPTWRHIIAILASIIVFALISIWTTDGIVSNSSDVYDQQVWIKNAKTGEDIPNAEVNLIIAGIPPLTDITDKNGFARFRIDPSYGNVGRLVVIMEGFERLEQNVNLGKDIPLSTVTLNPIQ